MLQYPAFNTIAFEIGPFSATARSRFTGTESCISSASPRPGGSAASRARKPGSHLEARRHRRFHVLRHARRHSRRAHRLRAVLRPVILDAEDPWYPDQGVGRRHVVPWRLVRRDDRVRDLCRSPRAAHRRRLRFRRAAAGHRHLSPGASATSSTASCGASRPTCPGAFIVDGEVAACHAALRGVARRRAAVHHPVVVHVEAAAAHGAGGAVPRRLRRCRASWWNSGACPIST